MTEQPQPMQPPAPYQPTPMLEADARMWAMLINLAAVAGLVFTGGTLSVVAVIVIWLIYRERSALVDFHGKQQLNLAITVLIYSIAAVIGILFTFGLSLLALLAYGIFVIVISILAAVAANKGEYYRIPGIIRFVK